MAAQELNPTVINVPGKGTQTPWHHCQGTGSCILYTFQFALFLLCLPGWSCRTRATEDAIRRADHNRQRLEAVRVCRARTLSLGLINVIWHTSETGWVDRLLRFGPFSASPSSSTSLWLSQLTVWHWISLLSPDSKPPTPLFLSQQTEWNATVETAALIRNQLPPRSWGSCWRGWRMSSWFSSCSGRWSQRSLCFLLVCSHLLRAVEEK